MTDLLKVSPFGEFWRVSKSNGEYDYYEKNSSYQVAASHNPEIPPTVVKGFAVFNDSGEIVDVFPTLFMAKEYVDGPAKIVNVQTELSTPTSVVNEDSNDTTDNNATTDKIEKQSGSKPVRGTGSSRP